MDHQASNTTTYIGLIASGQEKTVQLPRTRYDSVLPKSIISLDRARASKGTVKPCAELVLTDSSGRRHVSKGSISARWHVQGGAQSWGEEFFIVEKLGGEEGWDAVLRKDIRRESGEGEGEPRVYAFVMEKESKGEKERKREREKARVNEREGEKARSEGRVRREVERMRGELKEGRRG
jgi:hypothetical protein